jgi:hypothetical protein
MKESASNKPSKNVATVRVWKRKDRGQRWYCTLKLPAVRRTLSCGTPHRSAAEQYAALALSRIIAGQVPPVPPVRLNIAQLNLALEELTPLPTPAISR